ncbi:neurogenic locus notch homolog protein 1-like [Acanthaster planci]|uniref:Neurogenic locus notch homolog protein 1-like n=1 Tax=Acanthaster planci TaxID=133434 RepID=A0A8B7YNW0_ACAPL|nr:neurogenic locus notch homolog protein 1-like [Acanthaster planci]
MEPARLALLLLVVCVAGLVVNGAPQNRLLDNETQNKALSKRSDADNNPGYDACKIGNVKCLNGGTCYTIYGSPDCRCAYGYFGSRCQFNRNQRPPPRGK